MRVNNMNENRTWIASTLFLDIVGYSKRSVDEQLKIKVHFNSQVADRITQLKHEDCIRLDTDNGAAICYLGDPEKMYPIENNFEMFLII